MCGLDTMSVSLRLHGAVQLQHAAQAECGSADARGIGGGWQGLTRAAGGQQAEQAEHGTTGEIVSRKGGGVGKGEGGRLPLTLKPSGQGGLWLNGVQQEQAAQAEHGAAGERKRRGAGESKGEGGGWRETGVRGGGGCSGTGGDGCWLDSRGQREEHEVMRGAGGRGEEETKRERGDRGGDAGQT